MKMNQRGNDNFETPDFIFNQLKRIFNFNFDVACTFDNCKTNRGFYFDDEVNGLNESWDNKRCFCNPPFSQKADWIKKADYEVQNNNCPICVMILPLNCMDTEVWWEYIEGKYPYETLQGRISFIDPATGKPKSGNNSGTVIVYFKKKVQVKQP